MSTSLALPRRPRTFPNTRSYYECIAGIGLPDAGASDYPDRTDSEFLSGRRTTSPTPIRILCVDDHPDAAETTATLLELYGYVCRACFDGPSALAEAEAFDPDVCILDLHMPGMDGDVLAARLRQAGRCAFLIALTAMHDNASSRRIAAAGFDRHFVKPLDPALLAGAIAIHIRDTEPDFD